MLSALGSFPFMLLGRGTPLVAGRGCTPEFSCSKAQKIFLIPRTQPKLGERADQATCRFLPKIAINYLFIIQLHFSLNQPLQYYYHRITRACSRFWRRSCRGTSLARATVKPESQICNSPWRKNHCRTPKFTGTMAILPLSSAEVPPRNA